MVAHFFVWDLRVVPDSLAPSNCHTPSFQNRVTTSRRGKSPLSHWSQSCKTAKKSECCLTFFCLSCSPGKCECSSCWNVIKLCVICETINFYAALFVKIGMFSCHSTTVRYPFYCNMFQHRTPAP